MKTVSQVTKLTGVSARTLQYYDQIGLLKPTELTQTGYRLYDDESLQKLQHILFFKELGFTLREINQLISQPDFDKISAFTKQKELLLIRQNRTNRLIQLLSRLEKGEQCMSFKEFDLSEYINALEEFRNNSMDDIVKHWGNIENFNLFIEKIKEDEDEVAKQAIKLFGSVENYTETMKYNLLHFSEIMEENFSEDVIKISEQSDTLYVRLTLDRSKDASSDEIQHIVQEIDEFIHKNAATVSLKSDFWTVLIDSYSNDYVKAITDTKYGTGASDYIVNAFRYYVINHQDECN